MATPSPANGKHRGRAALAVLVAGASLSALANASLPLAASLVGAAVGTWFVASSISPWPERGKWRHLLAPIGAAALFGAVAVVAAAVVRSTPLRVALFNVDDHETITVDGKVRGRANFLDRRTVDLGELPASARVTVGVINDAGGYAWGVKTTKGSKSEFCESAGHAGVLGGGSNVNDTTVGVVRRLVFDGNGELLHAYGVHPPTYVPPLRC